MRLDVLMIGKIGERQYRLLVDQYCQRCLGRLPIEIVPCRNDRAMEQRAAQAEYLIALDEHGPTYSTDGFVAWLKRHIHGGRSRMSFCLGGAAGLSPTVKAAASETVSLSPLTLNHQLALLVLCEQLYRAISIMFGEPYHKP